MCTGFVEKVSFEPGVMTLDHQAVQFGMAKKVMTLCRSESNNRLGIALAMHHSISYAPSLKKGEQHATYRYAAMK